MRSHWKLRFRSARWVASCIALIGLTSQFVFGQSPNGYGDADTREQLVVLKSGRILTGHVSRNSGGYLVEQPNGRLQMTESEVQFVADDLHQAYTKHRDSVRVPTPATHLALANWCISYKLYEEARDELKNCLKEEPENEEARRLLQRLTDTMRANLPAASAPPQTARTFDGFSQPQVESLGGLTRETATQYTSKIQPLLLNKCGNANCHGNAATNDFHLVAARVGSNGSRQLTERNLAETLDQLDIDNVGASPLLRVPNGGHGGKGTIFAGPAGGEQLKLLKAWAKTVAQEKQAQRAELAGRPKINSRHSTKPKHHYPTAEVKTAAYVEEETNGEHDEPVIQTRKESPESSSSKSKPRELPADPEPEKSSELKPVDPFDPDTFNRRLP